MKQSGQTEKKIIIFFLQRTKSTTLAVCASADHCFPKKVFFARLNYIMLLTKIPFMTESHVCVLKKKNFSIFFHSGETIFLPLTSALSMFAFIFAASFFMPHFFLLFDVASKSEPVSSSVAAIEHRECHLALPVREFQSLRDAAACNRQHWKGFRYISV
jgi:hypothetical protein